MTTKFTVGGVPWEDLTEEKRQAVRKKATDIAAGIVTKHVQSMIDEGKSLDEINKFLGLDNDYKNWGRRNDDSTLGTS